MSEANRSLLDQLRGFDRAYWICIFMELMERMAYYGVRLVVPVYLVLAPSEGGPGLDHVQKGTIFAAWAAMQSWLPTFSGGFSDRYGYKKTIGISVFLKTFGYVGMALATDFWTMLLGTQLLAAGTGLFKPGIQGTMAHSIAKREGQDSMGWGLFYQSVNVGAAISAYIPAAIGVEERGYGLLFFVCSAIVFSNLLALFFYEEPHDERQTEADTRGVGELISESIREVFTSPVLMGFILISAGFWFTFHQLFDMLPNYVDDWTNSWELKGFFGNLFGLDSWVAEAEALDKVPQERILNINAIMITFTMFFFAWLVSRMHALTSTIIGMIIATSSMAIFMVTANIWAVLIGVVVFTVGEMLSSPKRQEYLASLAPPGKRALYLGYANMPDGIGWVLGSLIAGRTYEEKGDKINLAREFYSSHVEASDTANWLESIVAADEAMQEEARRNIVETLELTGEVTFQQALDALRALPDPNTVLHEVLPRGQAMDWIVAHVPTLPDGTVNSAEAMRVYLFEHADPAQVWDVFFWVSAASVVLMVGYDRFARARNRPQ